MSSRYTTARAQRVAVQLSIIGHPFVVIVASVGALAMLRGSAGVRPALVVAVPFIAASAVILLGIGSGRFNDFDVSEREKRPGFYAVLTLATLALAVWIRDDAGALRACLIASGVLGVCGLLNRWTKASLHTAFALYAAGLWGAWSLAAGLAALPLAAGVAWSRACLGRHTWSEIGVGAAVGLVGGALLLAGKVW